MSKILSILLATTLLVACDLGPNAQKGAAIGAVTGFLTAGGDRDKQKRGIVTGAIVGGVIGNELDRQAAALEAATSGNVLIQNTGDRLIVTLPQDILFDVNSTRVSATLQSDLSALAQNLRDYPNSDVQVIGHTDSSGSIEYNQNLSSERALAVLAILTQGGVPTNRLQAVGQGETQPVATNQTAAGRAQNRRVEVVILPN